MPQGSRKSKTLRRVFRKTPGGNSVLSYRKRKPKTHKCGICGSFLPGTIRERPYKAANVPKSSKRPERAFGGVLCSTCSRKKIIEKARN